MAITLPPDVEQELNELVARGEYDSPVDAVRAALAVLREFAQPELTLDELRREIDKGLASAEAGHVKPFDEAAVRGILARMDADRSELCPIGVPQSGGSSR